ncbi:MAG TPA: IPT/TIG domain-containing protein [Candidatus Acidoferrum sp.]|nr:IPT/TIG domain-containing protein [Candidatus Acidoferrum sp.]
MGRLQKRLPIGIFALLPVLCAGCGGGGGSAIVQPPPPPAADFSITLSSASLSVSQGATGPPVTLSVSGQSGFTGAVQVTLAGLPTGVAANPASTFSVMSGANTAIVFGAATNAPTGNFTVTAQGVSGSLSHSATLSLAVQASSAGLLPRTTYARTDAVAAFDDPLGEPRHRRIAYDAANKHVFVTNRAMNRVEVFSSADQTRVAQITLPAASSADLSADGATLWVGSTTEQVVAIDTATLKIKSRNSIQPLSPIPNIIFDRPEELLPMSNGKIMMRLRQSAAAQSLLAIWDPVANSLTNLTSVEPALFQNGLGTMARTGDHTKLIVAANDASGEAAIFDATGAAIAGSQGFGAGTIPLVAANPDGTRFAVEFVSAGATQLFLFDAAFSQVAAPVSFRAQGLVFSRDGNFLYASESAAGSPLIETFDGHTMQPIGQVPDASIQGVHSEIEEVDETQLLFGIANRGVSFIDAAKPVALPSSVPSFASVPAAQPSQGPFTGATATLLAGQNFESSAQIKFGQQVAAAPTVSPRQIQVAAPPSVVSGAVNVTAYFPSGWLTVAPDAFSYGPQILEVLPNGGSKTGGEAIQIYGYGFASDAAQITAQIGGATATVQIVENVTSIAPSLALDATYPFPLQRITLLTPPGAPGQADITVKSEAGGTTSPRAFQYMQSAQVFAKPALCKFVLYDQKRQWLYLSNTDHVDVFDLAAAQFHATGINPPGGPPPNAALRGLSLTPDASQLFVADFGAQSVYLLNPDVGTGTTVPVGGVAGFLNSGPARIAATSAQTVFVAMSGEGSSSGVCSSCLSQLNLSASPPTVQPAPQPEVTSLTGAPLVQADATGDTVFLAYIAATGGPVGTWSAAAPNQFTISFAEESAIDVAAASDGTVFASRAGATAEIRGPDLTLAATPASPDLEQIPTRVLVPGFALHPTGALLYQPFLTGPAPAAPPATGIQGGVDILDAHTGLLRLRIFLPEPLATLSTDIDALHGSFLAVDENGQRIFALTTSGLTVVQLANVPLSIGTIAPASASAAGGTTLTIRGSGFQSGATVTIGGKSAATKFVDINTLTVTIPPLTAGPQQVLITNPNGDSYALDAAFRAN